MADPFSPFFTTNESDITALEGLYVKERNPPASVRGVNLNAVAVGGTTAKGPVGKVVQITSEARFLQVFGGKKKPSGTSYESEVHKSLLNKRFGTLYVTRAYAAAAVVASFDWETAAGGAGTAVLRISANGPGLWGNDVQFKVMDATDGVSTHFNLLIRFDGSVVHTLKNLNINTSSDDNLLTILGDDDGNYVTLLKLANGRPVNTANGVDGADADAYVNLGETVSGFTSVAGTDGSLADSDFTSSGKVLDLLANQKGAAYVYVAGRSNSAVKAGILTRATAASDRIYGVCPDNDGVSPASAITEAGTLRSDRIVYSFNHAYTVDPSTATEIVTEPHAWMGSIFSQTDVNDHVGNTDTKALLSGIRRLDEAALDRNQYVSFKSAGIAAMGQDVDGFVFVSGVTTSLTPGKEEIARRRCTDFLQLSLAGALAPNVKRTNTLTRRKAMVGLCASFLQGLKDQERIVEEFSVDGEILNTPAGRAAGIERLLVRVRLIGHILHLVLETEIGTAVTVTEVN